MHKIKTQMDQNIKYDSSFLYKHNDLSGLSRLQESRPIPHSSVFSHISS